MFGLDQSFFLVDELRPATGIRSQAFGSGIGLFATLAEALYAILLARRLFRDELGTSCEIVIYLNGIREQALVFDYDSIKATSPSLPGTFKCSEHELTIGGIFQSSITDDEVVDFIDALGREFVYRFGWTWRADYTQPELRRVLTDVAHLGS